MYLMRHRNAHIIPEEFACDYHKFAMECNSEYKSLDILDIIPTFIIKNDIIFVFNIFYKRQ